ncbi:hypothetical protein BC567DRAFT_235756 [Phyllosticta citribraziliensis]
MVHRKIAHGLAARQWEQSDLFTPPAHAASILLRRQFCVEEFGADIPMRLAHSAPSSSWPSFSFFCSGLWHVCDIRFRLSGHLKCHQHQSAASHKHDVRANPSPHPSLSHVAH